MDDRAENNSHGIIRHIAWHLVRLLIVGMLVSVSRHNASAADDTRPNIVWIMAEDMGPDLGCYGLKVVHTPVLNKLAAEGARYNNCFCTAPVCSTSRSAMMTGMYQNAIGAHQHRTAHKQPLPDGVRTIVAMLREAGYYTLLGGSKRTGGGAKTDFNFVADKESLFQSNNWEDRPKDGTPFFAQITFPNTHRTWGRDAERPIDPADVTVPPYYPDTPLVRRDIANGLEEIQRMDRMVGRVLADLRADGVLENTVIFFIGDNGLCEVRGKQFLYDQGLHVPLIVHWPGRIEPGTVVDDLVSTIDISAAILAIAGVDLPDYLQGRDFLNPATRKREFIFAARDKMDDTHDAMRAVRSHRYKYILNLMPERAYCQLNEYKERQYPILALLNVMNLRGELNELQRPFMAATKPEEELYDLEKDPYEVRNVADDPAYADIKQQLREELAAWRQSIHDQGVSNEFRKGGWSAKYPTKTLDEWETILADWEKELLGNAKP